MSEHGECQVMVEEWVSEDGRRAWSRWSPTAEGFEVGWSGGPLGVRRFWELVDSPYAARDLLIGLGFSYVGQRPRVLSWCGPDGFSARFTADTRVAWFTVERG